jgi:hypothetical protein
MSLNDAISYEYEYDQIAMENEYPAIETQYIAVRDSNNQNYLNGWVNFSSNGLLGRDLEKLINFSNGYLALPYTVQLKATGALFGNCTATAGNVAAGARTMADLDENAFAVGVKNYLHFIDNYSLKYNSLQVNNSGNAFSSLMMQEKLKKMNDDEYKLYSDIVAHAWDSTESYNMCPDAGTRFKHTNLATENIGLEINNNTVPSVASTVLAGSNPSNFANKGHIERMRKTNHDLEGVDYLFSKIMTADKIANSLQSVFKGVSVDKKTLTWTGMAIIPLPLLSDFFAKIGTVGNANFELKLQTNLNVNNSWSYNLTSAANPDKANAIANSAFTDQFVSAVQSIGSVCPFMMSQPAYNSNTGLSIFPDIGATDVKLTITSSIGYDSNNSIPAMIYLPIINMNPILAKDIFSSSVPQRILYDDFHSEWIENVSGTGQVRKSFQNQLNRPRKLLIFPFLSKSLPCKTPVYQQCTSSAPNTVTPIRLRNFQITRGSQNMFTDKHQYNYQFYQDHYLRLESINGASLKSAYFSGQITKSMWEKCYGVYEFDITGSLDEVQDNLPKSFGLEFDVDTVNTLAYDFLVVMTTQSELYLNRATGLLTTSAENRS